MAIMVASEEFKDCLYAFIFGYARFDVKNQKKRIYSLLPLLHPLFIIPVAVILILYLLYRRRREEISIEQFLTRHNEGILISEEKAPGVLTGGKEDLTKLLDIATDRLVIENGITPDHVFFLLSRKDFDIFSGEFLKVLYTKHVWLFIENIQDKKVLNRLRKIGKVILFDPDFMKTCGSSMLILGIIPRVLSLISKGSDTNLDHIHAALPDLTTISYVFPADVHSSIASVLKHQKYLCMNHGEVSLQITNCRDYVEGAAGPLKYVKAEAESFFMTFRRCA